VKIVSWRDPKAFPFGREVLKHLLLRKEAREQRLLLSSFFWREKITDFVGSLPMLQKTSCLDSLIA
jgi:hypothetical protein